jgi:conjugative transfer ATPase
MLLRLLGVLPHGRKPLTREEYAKIYREPPSFAQYLPWKDFSDEDLVFEFDDGVSVGAVFELTPIDVEGKSMSVLKKIELGIQKAFQSVPTHVASPWIVQTYLQDDPITDLADMVRRYATDEARKTNHHELWLKELDEHVQHISKPGGMFYDQGSRFWWGGQYRRVRCCVYRNSKKSEWLKNGRPIPSRGTPAQELNDMINAFVGALEQTGIAARRYKASDLYRWLLPWFSPRPEGFDSAQDYLKVRRFPEDPECLGASADLAEMVVLGAPESRDNGNWYFTGKPHRLVPLQAIDTPPITGVLTAEQESAAGRTASLWDQMPKGCIFVSTVVALPQSQVKSHCNHIIKAAGQGSAESRLSAAQAEMALDNIAAGESLMPAFFGVYVSANTDGELVQKTQKIVNLLTGFQFNPVIPKYDPTAMDNYLRHLPMSFSYEHDKTASQLTRLTYVHHIARIFALYGRGTGTGKPAKLFFNRIGEPLTFDPAKDRVRVAHGLIFGPTGCGKSATINYMCLQDMAVHKPRLFIIEKGDSFGLLGKYFATTGLSVNRVKFTPATDISLPPYANAFEALAEAEVNEAAMELALTLTADDILDSENLTLGAADDDEMRDYLGEMELLTRMMITGADADKEKQFDLPDKQLVRRAILDATRKQRDAGADFVLPIHVVRMFREYAANPELSANRKERIQFMADALEYWTEGLHGKFFNRPGKAWPECDVTILDMGMLTSDQYKDMLAVAIISMINTITGIGEKYQYQGRQTQVYTDEGHAITTNPTLVKPFVFGAKTWRKLNIWLTQATQQLDDYPDEAGKMLSLAEWWYCLMFDEDAVRQLSRFKTLNDEQRQMLTSARKQKGCFTEGVVLSDRLDALFRIVMPALPLALAGTDDDEKAERRQLMDELGITEIEAVYHVANRIKEARSQ